MGVFVVYFVFLLFIFCLFFFFFFFFKQKTAYEIGRVTGVQTCALPIYSEHDVTNFYTRRVSRASGNYILDQDSTFPLQAQTGRQNRIDGAGKDANYAPMNMSIFRSEERRVGKECRSRWAPDH